ncbi:hypothetical protein BN13_80031 [Nostocoides jenkinsii Ben 74]|uniref:Uncharacterized protein n=1 Tax=Nostocoides jenkinsii Ben 74 TaxID=1193518 RepID=A0A077MGP9_9MICO|nr:hypothetical protein BN13_80031 [Tetrasphaera jenkinsii Ben 74]
MWGAVPDESLELVYEGSSPSNPARGVWRNW